MACLQEIKVMNMEDFFGKLRLAVVGASNNEDGFGYKVYRDLKKAGFKVVPVNPKYDPCQGDKCYETLDKVPGRIGGIVCITPPAVTNGVLALAHQLNIKNVWLQPGAESKDAIRFCEKTGINCVHGLCIMVQRRYGGKDPFEAAMEELEMYDEGTEPRSSKDNVCCGGH